MTIYECDVRTKQTTFTFSQKNMIQALTLLIAPNCSYEQAATSNSRRFSKEVISSVTNIAA